jgi:hypothetical protein
MTVSVCRAVPRFGEIHLVALEGLSEGFGCKMLSHTNRESVREDGGGEPGMEVSGLVDREPACTLTLPFL